MMKNFAWSFSVLDDQDNCAWILCRNQYLLRYCWTLQETGDVTRSSNYKASFCAQMKETSLIFRGSDVRLCHKLLDEGVLPEVACSLSSHAACIAFLPEGNESHWRKQGTG